MWQDFHGPNAGYVLELYDRYRQDPNAVDAATRAYFDRWTPPVDGAPVGAAMATAKIVGVVELAHSIRAFGHLAARLDPLGSPPRGDPALELAPHGLTEEDLRQMPAGLIHGP
ncbi:MAG: 2-oxoglutarate dehydrogenase E1 component, partial [candidate division NC10 bacterium]|nr:2-oxoglutarate dehydrogenase E1 component [candidate division NC10 bacterium]